MEKILYFTSTSVELDDDSQDARILDAKRKDKEGSFIKRVEPVFRKAKKEFYSIINALKFYNVEIQLRIVDKTKELLSNTENDNDN